MVERKSLTIAEAICTGIFLYFILAWLKKQSGLPLFDFYPAVMMDMIHPLLSVIIFILVLFQRKFFRPYLILMTISLLITTIFNYTSNFAFRYFTPFIFLFAFLFSERRQQEKKAAAQLIVGCLFLFSAIHKMNPQYLEGAEFIKSGTFMAFYKGWFNGLVPETLPSFLAYLPHFSILTELFIAVGVIVAPAIFAHVAALFLLLLSFINPPVLNVFFLHLPFFILMDEGLSYFLEKANYKKILSQPYVWGILIYVSTHHIRLFSDALLYTWTVSSAMIVMHLIVLTKKKTNAVPGEFSGPIVWILPTLMLFLFIGSYLFLPSPIGFKMFSAKKFQLPFYELTIEDHTSCKAAEGRWFFSQVTDSGFSHYGDGCHLYMPTKGGLAFAARELCKENTSLQFKLKKSDEDQIKILGCVDL